MGKFNKLRRFTLPVLACGVLVGLLLTSGKTPQERETQLSPRQERSSNPSSLAELLALGPDQVSHLDMGLMNILCAEGLPGAESMDIEECLSRLDGIARYAEQETSRHFYRFQRNPGDYNHSEGYFRMLFLTVVLQEDLKIRYNPERVTRPGVYEHNHVFFADAQDVFIHGMIGARQMGTCSSLPVFYVAIGRRLGYPLKLVTAKNHLFVRWEDDRERFNVDATGIGFNIYDDDHYRQWPIPMTYEEEERFGYLKSLSPAEELSVFLSIRGHCLIAAGRKAQGIEAHEAALNYAPESKIQQMVLTMARREVHGVEIRRVSMPSGPNPMLHSPGDEAYWAARRAADLSRRRK